MTSLPGNFNSPLAENYGKQLDSFFKKSGISSPKKLDELANELAKPGWNNTGSIKIKTKSGNTVTLQFREIGGVSSGKQVFKRLSLINEDTGFAINNRNYNNQEISLESLNILNINPEEFSDNNTKTSANTASITTTGDVKLKTLKGQAKIKSDGDYSYEFKAKGIGKIETVVTKSPPVNIALIVDNSRSLKKENSTHKATIMNMENNLANHIKDNIPEGSNIVLIGMAANKDGENGAEPRIFKKVNGLLVDNQGKKFTPEEAIKGLRTNIAKENRQTTYAYRALNTAAKELDKLEKQNGLKCHIEQRIDISGSDITSGGTDVPEDINIDLNPALNLISAKKFNLNIIEVGPQNLESNFKKNVSQALGVDSHDKQSIAKFENSSSYETISYNSFDKISYKTTASENNFGYEFSAVGEDKKLISQKFNSNSIPTDPKASDPNIKTKRSKSPVTIENGNISFSLPKGLSLLNDNVNFIAQEGDGTIVSNENPINALKLNDNSTSQFIDGDTYTPAANLQMNIAKQDNYNVVANYTLGNEAVRGYSDDTPNDYSLLDEARLQESFNSGKKTRISRTPLFASTISMINQANQNGEMNKCTHLEIHTDGIPNDIIGDNGRFRSFGNNPQTGNPYVLSDFTASINNLNKPINLMLSGSDVNQSITELRSAGNFPSDADVKQLAANFFSAADPVDFLENLSLNTSSTEIKNKMISIMPFYLAAFQTGGNVFMGDDAASAFQGFANGLNEQSVNIGTSADQVKTMTVMATDNKGQTYELEYPVEYK